MLAHLANVLSPAELKSIETLLDASAFRDGSTSARGAAKEAKQNLEFRYGDNPARDKELGALVIQALGRHLEFMEVARPKAVMTPIFSRYETGMSYGTHTDAPAMNEGGRNIRIDLSVTLFLSDPNSYQGGELVVDTGHGEVAIKHPKGDAVTYPTTVLHRVEAVRSGVRLAAVTWVESHTREEWKRRILYDLRKTDRLLAELAPDAPELVRFRNSMNNLERLWWEP